MLIIAGTYGQLGNMLKRYCHVLAFAWEYHLSVCNPTFHEYENAFVGTCVYGPGPYPITLLSRLYRPFRRLTSPLNDGFNRWIVRGRLGKLPGVNHIQLASTESYELTYPNGSLFNRPTILQGYHFHCKALVAKHADALRAFFTPIDTIAQPATALVNACRQHGTRLVGVHVRWGDYQDYRSGEYYFDRQTYQHHMDRLKARFPDDTVHFLICSNVTLDPAEWERPDTTIGHSDSLVELTALSLCDAILGPPSSFSDWASFYGQVPRYYMLNTTDTQVFEPHIDL